MARISQRFENPNGRNVAQVDAEVVSWTAYFPDHYPNPPVNLGAGFYLKLADGRSICVRLTHAELADLAKYHADFDTRYGRPA